MAKKLSFYPSLVAGKILLRYYNAIGYKQWDRAGMASMRLCDDFLKYVKKPPLTFAVSGTNGKTTITSMITDILRKEGKTVAYNDWGANHFAGHARCLLDAVNVFNRSTKDAAVIEMDELISPINMPAFNPTYTIITNIGRDSMLGNAHPDYIREKLEQASDLTPDSFYIVNADSPLCTEIGKNNKRVFYGVTDLGIEHSKSLTDDFPVCNFCGTKPKYNYKNYHIIGDYYCPNCGFKRPDCDYFVEKVDYEKSEITVREPKGTFVYPVNSTLTFNIYNYIALIALFREMGMDSKVLANYLKEVYPPVSRETSCKVGNIELKSQMCKGQNVFASSMVFETVAKAEGDKCVVLLLDEYFKNDPKQMETIAWIFDTDYELLNNDKIKKIVVGGRRYLDHKVRLLMAGIPPEKIVCVKDYKETPNHVLTEGVDSIYVLHDVNFVSRGKEVKDKIKEILIKNCK